MDRKIERVFRAPYAVPNGLQLTDEGLWIADQLTDRVALVEMAEPNQYGVTKILREIPSESSTTSGLTYGEGALWLAANGPCKRWRPSRPTDASPGEGAIFKVDPRTGATLTRYPNVPGEAGAHGIEYDRFEAGRLWIATPKSKTISQVRTADWAVVYTIPLAYGGDHGMVRLEDAMWAVVSTGAGMGWDRIVKLSLKDGKELDRIDIGESLPEPHGMSVYGGDLLYCSATSGWVAKITL